MLNERRRSDDKLAITRLLLLVRVPYTLGIEVDEYKIALLAYGTIYNSLPPNLMQCLAAVGRSVLSVAGPSVAG